MPRRIHPKEEKMSRRESMARMALFSFGCSLSAIPDNALAIPKTDRSEAFVGSYSDPINHPGGTRTIKLLEKIGDYHLAEVAGGGGKGEPTNYVLPALVAADRFIIIDFSPKGGPTDFTGVLQKDGSIKFLKDGNRWPRL